MADEIKEEEKQEEKKEEKKEEKMEPEKPLDKMTATELREIARGIGGVTGVHAMKKEELLNVVKEARGIKDEEPAREKKKAVKETAGVKELKLKVLELKKEKEAARMAKDKKKVDILRLRINRLKKRTKKVAQA